jgi:hypothetical protein
LKQDGLEYGCALEGWWGFKVLKRKKKKRRKNGGGRREARRPTEAPLEVERVEST